MIPKIIHSNCQRNYEIPANIKHLKENLESIVTSNSSIITKEPGQQYKNEDGS